MSFTRETVLGRRVRIDDWMSFHRDRLLKALYEIRDAASEEPQLTITQVEHITGLKTQDVCALLNEMSLKRGPYGWPRLLRSCAPGRHAATAWTITERGVRWVEESPTPR